MTEYMSIDEYRAMMEQPKRHKYNASRTVNKGRVFDSGVESDRYDELLLMQSGGLISRLECQPRFTIIDGFKYRGHKIREATYTPDFKYYDEVNEEWIVEDVKSEATRKKQDYRLRVKLFKARYGDKFRFKEVIR